MKLVYGLINFNSLKVVYGLTNFNSIFLNTLIEDFFYMNINLQLKIKEQKKTSTRHLALEDAWDKLKNY